MEKIESLTIEQEKELQIFRDKWKSIGLSTEPVNRGETERVISEFYSKIGKEKPIFWYFDSPLSCQLIINFLFDPQKIKGNNLGANLRDNLGDNLWNNLGANLRANLRNNLRDNLGDNLWDNLRDNLGANLWANLGDNLGDNLWANLWANLGDNLGANLGANLWDNLGDNLWNNLRNNLWNNLWDNLRDNLRNNLRDNLGDNLRANLWNNLGDNLWNNLWANLRDNLRNNLRDNLGANLRDNLGDNLWNNLGANLGDNLWANLWANLGDNLGANLGANLWDNLGANLRDNLGANLWANLRDNLGDNLRDNKDFTYHNEASWGQIDAYWIAYYLFGEKIGVKYSDKDKQLLYLWADLAKSSFWWWAFEGIVFISARPTKILKNELGQLHADGEMALEFKDGWGVNYFNGVRLPNYMCGIKANDWKAEWILTEENQEVKRLLLENIEPEKVADILKLKTLDTFKTSVSDYELVEAVNNPYPSRYRALRMKCPSTQKPYLIRVHPDTISAEKAVIALNGGVHPDTFIVEH